MGVRGYRDWEAEGITPPRGERSSRAGRLTPPSPSRVRREVMRSSLGSRERGHPYLVKSVSRLNVLSETSDTTRGAEAHAEPSASAPNALNTS
jgi:hypothetical protein